MGRPRKPESERLQKVMTAVDPATAQWLDRIAAARDTSVSALLRTWLAQRRQHVAPGVSVINNSASDRRC